MNLNDLKEIDRAWTNTPMPLANPKPPVPIVFRCIRQGLHVFLSLLAAALYIALLAVFPLFFACSALLVGMLWLAGRLVRHKNNSDGEP